MNMNNAIFDDLFSSNGKLPEDVKEAILKKLIGDPTSEPEDFSRVLNLYLRKINDLMKKEDKMCIMSVMDEYETYSSSVPFGRILMTYSDVENKDKVFTVKDVLTEPEEDDIFSMTCKIADAIREELDILSDTDKEKHESDLGIIFLAASHIARVTKDEAIIDAIIDFIREPSKENLSNLHFNKWIHDMPMEIHPTEIKIKDPKIVDMMTKILTKGDKATIQKALDMARKVDMYDSIDYARLVANRMRSYTDAIYNLMLIMKYSGVPIDLSPNNPTKDFQDICINRDQYKEAMDFELYRDIAKAFDLRNQLYRQHEFELPSYSNGQLFPIIEKDPTDTLLILIEEDTELFGDKFFINTKKTDPIPSVFTKWYYNEKDSSSIKDKRGDDATKFLKNNLALFTISNTNSIDRFLKTKSFVDLITDLFTSIVNPEYDNALSLFLNNPSLENLSKLHPSEWFNDDANIFTGVYQDEILESSLYRDGDDKVIVGNFMEFEILKKLIKDEENIIARGMYTELTQLINGRGFYKYDVLSYRVAKYTLALEKLINMLNENNKIDFKEETVLNKDATNICVKEEDFKDGIRTDDEFHMLSMTMLTRAAKINGVE